MCAHESLPLAYGNTAPSGRVRERNFDYGSRRSPWALLAVGTFSLGTFDLGTFRRAL